MLDTRAQSIGIARLFLSLGVGAIVFFIVTQVTDPLFEQAKAEGSGQVATNGTTWLQMGVNNIPIYILLISFFGMVAWSVYTREVLR